MERHGNKGYMAIGRETTKGEAVTPTVFVPLYDEDFTTEANYKEDNPITGSKFKRYQVLQGARAHKGSFTVMGEPNTIGYFLNMFMTRVSGSGSGPYTHNFEFDNDTDPHSYTVDFCLGGHTVHRFVGVQASELEPVFEENEMRLNVQASGLKSWQGREISTVTGSGPYNINLKTDHGPRPTEGLVVGDTLQVYDVSANAYIDCIVDSLTDTTVTVSEDVSAGGVADWLQIKPATPSFSLRQPFLWTHTEFRFGNTAAAAINATQTRLEPDTALKVMHPFEEEDGSQRSGDLDPESLVRMQGDFEFNIKRYWDKPTEMILFNALEKEACVMRAFTEDQTYELRVTMPHLKASSNPKPSMSTEEVLYSDITFMPQEDSSSGNGIDIKIINNVATH